MPMQAPWKDLLVEPRASDHVLQLYRDERSLIEAVALYAGAGLGSGEAVILVATPSHLRAFGRRLEDQGFDLAELQLWGQLVVAEAGELLASLMVDGVPDRDRFARGVGGLIQKAREAGRYPKVRAYGEMVNLIWRADSSATARLEELWNELVKAHHVTLFCSYCVEGSADAERFPGELRALHSHVIPLAASA